MSYTKLFDPNRQGFSLTPTFSAGGDRRDGEHYVYASDIVLAVNVALATGRPLLLRGPSGAGKSTLARHVARRLGWRYYEEVVTSRTQARDLLWRFDTLRRLNDAQVGQVAEDVGAYIEPGVLWWAFDHASATRVAADGAAHGGEGPNAVVLVDEIDKADPDVPNNLLVPFGSLEFEVEETGERVAAQEGRPPLLIITTNDERELPPAFLRRCVVLTLPAPDLDRLVEVAHAHFGDDDPLFHDLAEFVVARSQQPGARAPSTAEYLDAIRACRTLGVAPGDQRWEQLVALVLDKPRPHDRLS